MINGARLGLIISVLFYCAALALPAFSYTEGSGGRTTMPGAGVLLLGAFGALFAIIGLVTRANAEYFGYLSWFANLLLLITWGCLAGGAHSKALRFGFAALGLALLFLTIHSFSLPDQGTMTYVSPSAGYFCWLASIGVAIFAGFLPAPEGVARARDPKARYVDW